jgi:hypothetical protein
MPLLIWIGMLWREFDPEGSIPRHAGSSEKHSHFSPVPRLASTASPKSEFDAAQNEKGDRVWHWGEKEFDPDSHTWDDDDYKWERATELEGDPHYADRYMWNCCEKKGSAKGTYEEWADVREG